MGTFLRRPLAPPRAILSPQQRRGRVLTDEQPELFSLAPPPPPKPLCQQCGSDAVVVRFGVTVCTVCRYGVSQSVEAQHDAERKAKGRQAAIQKSRRRRR